MSSKIEDLNPQARAMAREGRRKYTAKKRLSLRKAGLCIDCKKPSPDHWRCPFHREHYNRLKRKRIFQKWLKTQQKSP